MKDATMAAEFELLKDAESYYFVLKAANGEAVAQSQSYRSIADARKGMAAVQRAAAAAIVPEDDDGIQVRPDNDIHMHYRRS